jgi:phage terminase large subunit-like protein
MSALETDWQKFPLTAKLRLLAGLRANRWRAGANSGQAPPHPDFRVWYGQGARGSGKTRAGAEWLSEQIFSYPPGEWGIVAPTFGDARRKCVEGPSGLLVALGGADGPLIEKWNRSTGELFLVNGAIVYLDGADDGALRIQGENLRGLWADEIGLWKRWDESWNESIQFAVRLEPAQIVATGTPKGKRGIVKQLLEEKADAPDEVVVTRLRLADNERNLAPAQIASLKRRYAGTYLGRQELEGEVLEDVEGALWRYSMIDPYRVAEDPMRIGNRRVVAIDPAVTSDPLESDETGIIACATDHTEEGYVLADRSGVMPPLEWAKTAIALYKELRADRIIGEANNGGDLIETVLRQIDPNIPYRKVWASKGKQTRAEPVAALYEQGRIRHVEALPELETEMTTWVPGERSPNRMDALVWAFHDLILDRGQNTYVGGEPGEPVEPSITADLWDRPL